jgi:hypothetical protein
LSAINRRSTCLGLLGVAFLVGTVVGCDMNPSPPTDPSGTMPKVEVKDPNKKGGTKATRSIKDRSGQAPNQ